MIQRAEIKKSGSGAPGAEKWSRLLASSYRARFAVGSGKGKNVMAKEAPGRARCGQFLQDVLIGFLPPSLGFFIC
jgi:hypothetical protein